MEVLKHGKRWEEINMIVECSCGCKFKYTEDDISNYVYSTFGWKKIKNVKCPECNLTIKLEADLINYIGV